MPKSYPLIIAHRGASGEAPENTLAAFSLAVKQGCDGIELDVHLTCDGELVVFHDDYINRTTNGTGKISEMKIKELKRYDAGIWFHEKYEGETIPLLEEVFDAVPPEILINVEIKNIPAYYIGIEQKLNEVLRKKNRVDNVIVSSFDHKCLYRLKKINKNIKIGLLYVSNVVNHKQFSDAFGLPVYSLHPHYSVINQEDIAYVTKHGLQVYTWTVNDEKDFMLLIENGVQGIITNYPEKLYKLVHNNEL